ncbi:HAD-IIIA family hydrolase [Conexibacter sp. SYSU D00693]|uniref:HAD-IIIA family hydrolase n=1 Tax=Conexibacter sp. SYSU D00693 TaxID=2812560 RepID=UPI00196AAC17|nr:HAD-IIIA family hydrolase [Conexibacter sp. SYSU D00693]
MSQATASVDVVVPTVRGAALARCLEALARAAGPPGGGDVVLADDRRGEVAPLLDGTPVPAALAGRVRVVRSGGRGPAAARNAGWRACSRAWVAFVDDDVEVDVDWADRLADDLVGAGPQVGGVQGAISVPLALARRPTDRERHVEGLETAAWATADMAYRRLALEAVGGFDEGFPRAYREDADLALRVRQAGWELVRGTRRVRHPVGSAPWTSSLTLQRGNADDPRMAAKHGPSWRTLADVPPGRRRRHALVTAAGAVAVACKVPGTLHARACKVPGTFHGAAAVWALGTAELCWARIAPGPRTPREVARMVATSVPMPPVAVAHFAIGSVKALPLRRARRRATRPVKAVLLDRDGTLVHDVPYNGDPDAVAPIAGAREALDRLRVAGLPLGVVSNQSGIARGLLTTDEVDGVQARVAAELGPFGVLLHCPHGPGDGCACRKPAPGMVVQAARELGVRPEDCVVVGDIGADVEAARAAGARGILVPTPVTRLEEVRDADTVCRTLGAAVDRILSWNGEDPRTVPSTVRARTVPGTVRRDERFTRAEVVA